MTEFFQSIGSVFDFIIQQLSLIGKYFNIAFKAFTYLLTVIYTMPLYFKTVVIFFIMVAVILMVFDRG